MFSAPGLPPSPGGGGVNGSSGFWSSGILRFSGLASVLGSQFLVLSRATVTHCIYSSLLVYWIPVIIAYEGLTRVVAGPDERELTTRIERRLRRKVRRR